MVFLQILGAHSRHLPCIWLSVVLPNAPTVREDDEAVGVQATCQKGARFVLDAQRHMKKYTEEDIGTHIQHKLQASWRTNIAHCFDLVDSCFDAHEANSVLPRNRNAAASACNDDVRPLLKGEVLDCVQLINGQGSR